MTRIQRHMAPAIVRLRAGRNVLVLALAVLAGIGDAGAATPDEEFDRAIDALERRYQIAKRAVRYELEGTATVPRGRYSRAAPELIPPDAGDFPREDYQYRVKRNVLLDFEKGRIRREYREEILNGDRLIFTPWYGVEMFDGRSITKYTPRAENSSSDYSPPEFQPELSVDGKRVGLILSPNEEPLLLAHARFPTKDAPGTLTRLRAPLNRKLLRYHGYGALQGRECVVLRTAQLDDAEETYEEYWIATDWDGAVLRSRLMLGDSELRRTEVTYQMVAGTWLPDRATVRSFNRDGSMDIAHDLRIAASVIDPPVKDSDFHREPSVGMIVYSEATNSRYRYDGPGRHTDVSVLARAGATRWRVVGWVAAIAAAASLAAALLWRRARFRSGVS
jgi:hypothetical protein